MKEKITKLIRNFGGQIETYSPLMKATGYVVSRLDVSLLFGILPSVTPFISKVSDPDVAAILGFLKSKKTGASSLVKNYDSLVSQLENLEEKIIAVKSRLDQAKGNVNQPVETIDKVSSESKQIDPTDLLGNPEYTKLLTEYTNLLRDGVNLLASNVNSRVLGKLLSLIAKSIGGQAISVKGFEMREFSLDLGVMPTVSFALVRV